MGDADERRDAVETVTWGVRVAAAWSWRLLLIGLAILLVGRSSCGSSWSRSPSSSRCSSPRCCTRSRSDCAGSPGRRRCRPALALLVGIAALVGIGWFVTWQITTHSSQLGDQITNFVDKTRNWLHTGPLHLKSSDIDKIADNITKAIKDHQGAARSAARSRRCATVVEALGALLLILLSTFFLLRDGEQIWNWTLRLFPRRAQEPARRRRPRRVAARSAATCAGRC